MLGFTGQKRHCAGPTDSFTTYRVDAHAFLTQRLHDRLIRPYGDYFSAFGRFDFKRYGRGRGCSRRWRCESFEMEGVAWPVSGRLKHAVDQPAGAADINVRAWTRRSDQSAQIRFAVRVAEVEPGDILEWTGIDNIKQGGSLTAPAEIVKAESLSGLSESHGHRKNGRDADSARDQDGLVVALVQREVVSRPRYMDALPHAKLIDNISRATPRGRFAQNGDAVGGAVGGTFDHRILPNVTVRQP